MLKYNIVRVHVKFESDSLKGGDRQEDVRVDGRAILKRNVKKYGMIECNWLRIRCS
jgi:hypothetical protein